MEPNTCDVTDSIQAYIDAAYTHMTSGALQ